MLVQPQLSYPGVYVQEVSGGPGPIAGVPTAVTAFIGRALRGPVAEPVTVNDAGAFARHFGGLGFDFPMSYAVRDFFQAGGAQAVIVRLFSGGEPGELTVRERAPWVDQVRGAFRDGVDKAFTDADGGLDNLEGEFRDLAAQFDERPLATAVATDVLKAVLDEIEKIEGETIPDGDALKTAITSAIGAPTETPLHAKETAAFNAAIDAAIGGSSSIDAVVAAIRAATLDVTTLKTSVTGAFGDDDTVDVTAQMLTNAAAAFAAEPESVKDAFGAALRPISSEPSSATKVGAAKAAVAAVPDNVAIGHAANAVANAVERELEALETPPADLANAAKAAIPNGILALAPALFTLTADNPGAWANDLRAWIDFDGIGPDTEARFAADGLKAEQLFNLHLALVDARGRVIEREDHNSVTLKPGTRRTLGLVLSTESVLAGTEHTDETGARPLETAGGQVDKHVDDSAKLQIKDYANQAGQGFNAFDRTDIINLMCVPPDKRGGDTHPAVYAAAVSYARKRRAFLIVDGPAQWDTHAKNGDISKISPDDVKISGELARYAAVYFPRVNMADPEKGDTIHTFPVSGMIAGLYSRTDATRGVWTAPAGAQTNINGIDSLTHELTDAENGQLNPLGVNCLRTFPVLGTVVWGARTLAGADQRADEYKYIPVRRTASFIAESLYRGTQWAVFEPNDEPLWAQLRLQVGGFMDDLFRQGAFQGSAAKDAYSVWCDATTTTQTDIDLGIVNVVVSFAPLKPAEFVVIYLQQIAGANQ